MPLLRMATRTAVVAGTATAVSGRVARRQDERWQQKEAEQYQQQAAAAPQQPAAPEVDVVTQLKQLAELHDQGILTDEEFAAQKAKLLG